MIEFLTTQSRVIATQTIPEFPYKIGKFCYSKEGIKRIAKDLIKNKANANYLQELDINKTDSKVIVDIYNKIIGGNIK